MDPLAHTLVGASLAQSGLKRLSPLGTATLLIGANLPDVDAITYLIDRDLSLGVRRGWSHGIVAMIVWPVLLASTMVLVSRLRRRGIGEDASVRRASAGEARAGARGSVPGVAAAAGVRFGPLLLLSALSVVSHPALDWLNSYGIRLLMPFDGTWFYGDTLFIVDPWLWLLAGAAAVVGMSRGVVRATLWVVLGAATSALALLTPGLPAAARVAWVAGLAGILAGRWRIRRDAVVRGLAWTGLALAVAYIATMRWGTLRAGQQATDWLAARGVAADRVAALPLAASPLRRDVVATAGNRYYFVDVNWWSGTAAASHRPIDAGGPSALTDAALRAPHVWGLATWMRFPSFETVTLARGYRVYIRDVRFWRPDHRGPTDLGSAFVDLDFDLRPRPVLGNRHAPARRDARAALHPCLASVASGWRHAPRPQVGSSRMGHRAPHRYAGPLLAVRARS
jgi:inner membrane protein